MQINNGNEGRKNGREEKKRKGARKTNTKFPRKDQACGKRGKQGGHCKVPRKRMKILAGHVFDKLEFSNSISLESEELK